MQELDNRAQTLSDLENRLKMDEKAILDGFENLGRKKADFDAYMAEMQEQLETNGRSWTTPPNCSRQRQKT